MRTIYKYPLQIADYQVVEAPLPARVLSVKNQNNQLQVWIEVDTDNTGPRFYPRDREFIIIGTGQPMPSEHVMSEYTFMDTVIMNTLVWHVYVKNYKDER